MKRRDFLKTAVGTLGAIAFLGTSAFSDPILYGDGQHDDTVALNAWIQGKPVRYANGALVGNVISGKEFRVSGVIDFTKGRRNALTIESCYFHGYSG